ncbi:MAG TPA: zinc ribbon domain-containing protein [Pyrinomonadaceae bacterium]|nr:zinc ribbon domain-containing protein [Pyrinomonadaceae bacterium]
MYCPNCAAHNVDGASFCRACGANISLVPQALTGRMPETRDTQGALESIERGGRRSRRKDEEVRPEKGVENLFIGAAFLLVTILGALFFRGGFMIWIWFIIPGLSLVGGGVATLMRAKRKAQQEALYNPASAFPTMPPPPRFDELPAPGTSEIVPPASVTESTTRHLNRKDPVPSPRSSTEA